MIAANRGSMGSGTVAPHHRPLDEASGPLTPVSAGSARLRLSALLCTLVMTALMACGGGGSVAAGDVPPAGSIWFGTTYDVKTFHLTNAGTSFASGQQIAVVVHLASVPGTERVALYMTFAGVSTAVGYTDFTGNGYDIMADLVPAIYFTTPGQFPFQAKDSGGNVLATGTLTITQ